MTALTIFIILYWSISLFRAYRRGLVRVLVSILLYVLFFASLNGITPQVKASMAKQPKIEAWTQNVCEDFARSRLEEVADGNASGSLWLDLLALPEGTADMIASDPTGLASEILLSETTIKTLGSVLQPYFLSLIALLATAFISGLVLFGIGQLITGLARNHSFSGVNRFLGLVFGFFKVMILTWILFALIHGLDGTGVGFIPETQITNSAFLMAIDKLNPINQFIK